MTRSTPIVTDPTTGEVFADDSPYNHPMVARAHFTVLNHVAINEEHRKAKELEKLAEVQFDAVKAVLRSKSWQQRR